MKTYNFIPAILAMALFSACHNPIATFTEPQPKDSRDMNDFPNRIQGKFRNVTDSTILLISEKTIIKLYPDTAGIPSYPDTLLSLERGDVLRKFKGYYFLNTRHATNSWEVRKLALHRHGLLTLGEIATEAEINKLVALTDIPADSANSKVFDPSRKEFREFVNSHGFSREESYLPIE